MSIIASRTAGIDGDTALLDAALSRLYPAPGSTERTVAGDRYIFTVTFTPAAVEVNLTDERARARIADHLDPNEVHFVGGASTFVWTIVAPEDRATVDVDEVLADLLDAFGLYGDDGDLIRPGIAAVADLVEFYRP